MSPALITQAPAHTQHCILNNGQISHPFSFDFSGLSPENQSKQCRTLSHTMNSSNAGDRTSGFSSSHENISNIRFESPSASRSGSGLSRPRFVKVRRGLSPQSLRPTAIPEAQFGLGYNPFRSVSENTVPASSGSEMGTAGLGEFGKSGNEGFLFGANRNNSNESFCWGNLDSSGGFLVEDLKNLKIGSGNEFVDAKDGVFNSNSSGRVSSSPAMESDKSGFVSGSGYKNTHSIDESIVAELPEDMRKLNIKGPGKNTYSIDESVVDELPEDMRKLNIKGPGNEEHTQKTEDGRFNLSANDNFRFRPGSSDNVGGSLVQDMESELPNELKKLNIEETGQIGGKNVKSNAVDMNKFEFGSGVKGDSSFTGMATTLHNQMKNLIINDYPNTNHTDNSASKSSKGVGANFGRSKETLRSRKMKGSRSEDSVPLEMGMASPNAFGKDMSTGYLGDKLFQNLDKPNEQFTFLAGMLGKNAGGDKVPSDQLKDDAKLSGSDASSSSFASSGVHFQTIGNNFELPAKDRPEKRDEFIFRGKQTCSETPYVEFKTPNPSRNLFSGLNEKVEFSAKREIRDTRMKKKSGKSAHPAKVHLWLGQDFVSRGSSSQENPEVSDSYSPMDVSPYQETLANNRCSRENSVTSDESFSLDSYVATDSVPTVSNDAIDEDLTTATACLNINEIGATCRETKDEGFDGHFDISVGAEGHLEESASGAETESFKSATEEVDFVEVESSLSSNIETHDSDGRTQFGFATSSEDKNDSNFTFSASSAAHGQSSASKRLLKKKNWLKVGQETNNSIPNAKVPYASSSVQCIPLSGASLLLSPGQGQKGDPSTMLHKIVVESKVEKGLATNQESLSTSAATVPAQEACEKWRLRLGSLLNNLFPHIK